MAGNTHTKEGEAKIFGKNPIFHAFLAAQSITNLNRLRL